MANINLLPWREELRQEKQKEFLGILGVTVVIALLTGFFWINGEQNKIDEQKIRNQMLNKEIKELSARVNEIKELKKRREQLVERMQVIQGLQGERPVIVRHFDEFVRVVPEGIYINNLNRRDKSITLSGITESNVRVSAFMRNLDDSDWFAEPNLSSVRAKPQLGEQASEFNLSFKASKPKDAGSEEQN